MESLDIMRENVRNIDSEIIGLVKKRLDLTRNIGHEKKKMNIPLRNWEVEKAVVDNAARLSIELGLQPDFVKTIMQQLINESRIQQEIHHFSAYDGTRENILVVGGLGGMGRWFSRFFQNSGHNVSIFDTNGRSEDLRSYDNLQDALDDASCVVIATPLDNVPAIIDEITASDFKGTVFDVASLKSHMTDSVNNAIKNNISITSIHPMFGPDARTLSDKVICFCDCGDSQANSKVEALFKDTAASIVHLSFFEHDRIMSYVLGLSHMINAIFVKVLADSDYSSEELRHIGSTTYFSQMVTATSVIKENPELYYSIQRTNPFKEKLYAELKAATESITEMIIDEDISEFKALMKKGSDWVGG